MRGKGLLMARSAMEGVECWSIHEPRFPTPFASSFGETRRPRGKVLQKSIGEGHGEMVPLPGVETPPI